MKKILTIVLTLLVATSCDDNLEKGKPATPQVYPVYKNTSRVSLIEGKNERWGEFKMKVYYNSKEMLDSAWITNKENRRVAAIMGQFSNSGSPTKTTNIYDYIPSISQDSIERMDLALKAKYGEGNYSLIDSIKMATRAIRTVATIYYNDGRVSRSNVIENVPRKKLGTSGIDFNTSYLKNKEVKSRYEYDSKGKIIAVRMINDSYDVNFDLNSSFFTKSFITKQVMTYNDKSIERLEDCVLLAGENFSTVNDYWFNYSGTNISSIAYGGKEILFTRSGQKLTITDHGNVMTYQLDGNGYPIKIGRAHV